jgi:phage shock protein E
MRRYWKLIVATVVALGVVVGVSACSSSQPIDMKTVTAVIDVRTPAEFASGHLQGAVNDDIQATAFTAQIAKLDKNGTYVVYCKSGNRAGQAVTAMKAIGINNVTNAGGYTDASKATGLALVQ